MFLTYLLDRMNHLNKIVSGDDIGRYARETI